MVEKVSVINCSGWQVPPGSIYRTAKEGQYFVEKQTPMGDAPKDFVRIYEYVHRVRTSKQNWPAYIAKVGHKWYPNESITEQFLTRLGQALGFVMADSSLIWFSGQLRFCSRYFLPRGASLIHGAELFWGYLQDKEFVQSIERSKMSSAMFTFDFVQDAILDRFPGDACQLLDGFIHMLLFDSIVGNNDRHFYNWGFIEHPERKFTPRFAPIFDSARALFWNVADEKLMTLAADRKSYLNYLEKYVVNSRPKLGWDISGDGGLNHFQFIERIFSSGTQWHTAKKFLNSDIAEIANRLLESVEFRKSFSPVRKCFILDCLVLRLNKLRAILS